MAYLIIRTTCSFVEKKANCYEVLNEDSSRRHNVDILSTSYGQYGATNGIIKSTYCLIFNFGYLLLSSSNITFCANRSIMTW